jgi:inorganic phosphate transporter, PiT family
LFSEGIVTTILLVVVIMLALYFTYTNGFQDGSSVTAGGISTRAMSPVKAVLLVAACEMMGALLGGSAVSAAIRGITSWPERVDLLPVLISGLLAAITWNFITSKVGFPSSSTHALVGGIIGALFAGGGSKFIVVGDANILHPTGLWKVVITLFVSPLAGFVAGYLVYVVSVMFLLHATMRAKKVIDRLQWVSTAVLAFAHGANDPQKSMGIILLALHAAGYGTDESIPLAVRVAASGAIALGVLSLAPNIVRNVGRKIYKMRTLHGLAEETASASVVLFGSLTGGPVSASQVIASSVMGVGSAVRLKGVHWLVARSMLTAWFLTIPCSALLSFVLHLTFFRWLNHLLPPTGI